MNWTDERIELLKKLWTDGLSASQIAGELGGITRNAVIGKAHRLGLPGRPRSGGPIAGKRSSRPRTGVRVSSKKIKRLGDDIHRGSAKGPSQSALDLIDSVPTPTIDFDFSPESLMPHLYHPERYRF